MIPFLVAPRVSALAGYDKLISEPLVIENILAMFSPTRKKSRWGTVFPTGLKRYKEPLLSKRNLVIVCYEKVVRIPLEGDEILQVHGERSLGAAKALMNAKVDEPRISDTPMTHDIIDVFLEDLLGLPPQRQVEFRIDLVPGATSVANSSYRLAPSEMQELFGQPKELQDKGFK
ncbi:hypothetical protein Tco_1343086 [Tanacetum coccineum]